MSQSLYQALCEAGEHYAAALVIDTDRIPLYRYAHAAALYFANAALTPYDGGALYPCGRCINKNAENADVAVKPEFSYTYWADLNRLSGKVPAAVEILAEEFSHVTPIRPPHTPSMRVNTRGRVDLIPSRNPRYAHPMIPTITDAAIKAIPPMVGVPSLLLCHLGPISRMV